ncbi:MAG: S41 family peptidase [Chloroflexota bacterium]
MLSLFTYHSSRFPLRCASGTASCTTLVTLYASRSTLHASRFTFHLSITMNLKRLIFIYFAFLVSLSAVFGAGYLVRAHTHPSAADFPILEQAYGILENHAYDDLPEPPAIEYGMIHGMVEAYGDPNTRFVEPVQHELTTNDLEGSYGGIGARLGLDPEGYVVLYPFADGPAAEAGLLDGDRLIRVDEWEILPETPIDEVVAAIRGPEGERVTIEVARPPEYAQIEFTIKRQAIPLPSVTWHIEAADLHLGVIEVNIIAASTSEEIQNAVNDLQERGATHFVLDLRGNRGGLLDVGVDIARLFLSEGLIIQEQYRGQPVESYEVEEPGPLAEIPLVVLVNTDTASAAEIIAGALQSQGRALIIGTHTYGKDSIQLVFDLKDGSSIYVTAAKWWVPGLDLPIGEGGLQPDIVISTEGADGDPFIEAARSLLGQP